MNSEALGKSNFEDITLLKRGKVRDVYEIDDQLLIVGSDRISALTWLWMTRYLTRERS